MMRGVIVIITAVMAVIFLKRKLYKHHWTSLAVLFFGVFLVGLSSQIYPEKNSDGGGTSVLGIVLLLVSQLFAGTQFIVEEKLLGDYYIHPLKCVGWEGFWGCVYYIIVLPIF